MEKEYFAHETAVIDDDCKIGKGTKIWHFSHIMPNATIGERCIIGQNVNVAEGVIIGKALYDKRFQLSDAVRLAA